MNKIDALILVAGFAFVSLILGAVIGARLMQGEAVAHDAAHYDTKTAQFKWNDQP